MDGKQSIVAAVLCAGSLVAGALPAFEKVALVDSLDEARKWDVETPEGTLKVLDDALRPHSTRVLWRDKGACLMRYPCAEEPYPECEFPIDKRRVPPTVGAFWALRLDNCGFDVFGLVFGECARRGLGQGIHTTWEENHWCNSFMGTWNMRHPQFCCRAKGGLSWSGHASLAYPEVMEHKLRMVDERLRLRPQTIFLDMYRDGGWSPRLEYVEPVCRRWRERHGCEPPDNAKDDRWLELVSEYVTAYVKEFSRRCRAAGVEFVIGLPRLSRDGRNVWESYALDWRRLAAEGVFDGIWVMGFPIDRRRPFESTEEFYAYMMTQKGKASKVYFPLDEYNYRKEGLATYAQLAGCTKAEAARRLLEIAKRAGGAGVVYECVDCHLYPKDVCDALADENDKPRPPSASLAVPPSTNLTVSPIPRPAASTPAPEGATLLCEGGAPSFSKDGRRMAFQRAVGGKMRVGILDLKTGETAWPETEGNACHPFFAPDGSLVYSYANITNTAHERFILGGPQDGYGIRRWKDGAAADLTHGLWRDYQPSVSPDGKRLYFCTQRPHKGAPPIRVDSMAIDGGEPEPFILPAGQPYGDAAVGQPVVSPDGRLVAWAQINTTYDVWHVLAARVDDLDAVCAISPPDTVAYAPRWSPDGKTIAFTGYREGDPRWCVYLASLETGRVTRLCEGEDPDFSPDGKSIAYSDGGKIYMRFCQSPTAKSQLPTANCHHPNSEKVLFSTNGVPSALTDVRIPKECVVGRDETCFIRARFAWNGDVSCLQDVCRAGWLPSDCSLQLYVQKGGHPNFSIRDVNWQQTYLPATRPLSGAGEHTLTGIRTKDAIYLSVDDGPASVAPITRNAAPLDRPGKVAFSAIGFKPMDRIVSFEIGKGWPSNVPIPRQGLVQSAVGVLCQNFSSLDSCGSLRIDSSASEHEFGWMRYAMTADDFVPGERYCATFRARVEGCGKDSFLFVLVRPKGRSGNEKDLASLSVKPTEGEWKDCEMKFDVEGEGDYRLQFHGWNRLKAEIADLKIVKRPPFAFVPAGRGAKTGSVPLENLPQGAKEFEVDAPRNASGPVLDCADYGVSETNADNTAQLRAAFADAKAKGAAKLVLARGRYALNADSPLTLEDFRDFTFDGGGSVFVSYRHGGAFLCLRRPLRTKFMNFLLDWDWSREPLASIVRVKRVDAKSYDLEFVDYADFPNKNAALTVLSAYDPRTRSVGIEDGITRYLDMNIPPKRTWLDGRTLRVENAPGGLAVGQLYRAQHFYYHYHGFSLEDVEHLQLENVTVLSTPGHAFVMGGKSHHVAFDRVNIVPPKDDPRRVITCTADHFHIWQSRGFIRLDNCEFSLGADDIMNMHDNTAFVRRTGPRTVRALHASVLATARRGDRIEFRNGDYSPTGFFGTFVEAKRIPERRNGFDVTFAEDVPEEAKDGFILFNREYGTRNVIVRNCTFHDNRARALLILASDVTVENNVFRHQEMGAIKLETGYTYNLWSEGYGVSNVVIRGNLFDTVNPSGSYASHRQRSIYAGIYLRTDPSPDTTDYPIIRDILIEGNVFRDNTGATAYLSSVSNVVVRGNVMEDPTPRRRESPFRSQFFLTNARGAKIVDNVYRASPNVRSPGVAYDPETCSGIVVEGNRVE